MPPIWQESNSDPWYLDPCLEFINLTLKYSYTNKASWAYINNCTDIFQANCFKQPVNFDVNKPIFESQSNYAYKPIEKEELIFQDPDAFGDYNNDNKESSEL